MGRGGGGGGGGGGGWVGPRRAAAAEAEAEGGGGGGGGDGGAKMAAPVLLRVSVPRWERVARYAVCAAGILLSIYAYHVEREKERDPEHRALCDLGPWVKCSAALASRSMQWLTPIIPALWEAEMGSRIWSFGFHFWKGWCIKPAKQCLWTYILYTTVITWHDSKCRRGVGPHDVLHRVGRGVPVPGLHSVLCAEGVLHHLCHHVRAELHSPHRQLQTTSLLERGLETAAAAQAGLTSTDSSLTVSSPFPLSLFCSSFFFFLILHNRHFP
uniref:vitamin K epoxide reductase complex subunit 1-like protein 1 isoform X2 n=1 Tax=Callithrix jacchus TaxID=9483 RepID=UPI0023DCF656|nr:vitamin K epoxide reductase complex subunit 1-like protein 1 isoform X2 [Callithrix jacchus]